MKITKIGAGLFLALLLLAPSASYAKTQSLTNAERDRLIQSLVEQVQTLQQQVAVLQKMLNVSTSTVSTEAQKARTAALIEEQKGITSQRNWLKDRTKIQRVNEITKLLGVGCTYTLQGRIEACGG